MLNQNDKKSDRLKSSVRPTDGHRRMAEVSSAGGTSAMKYLLAVIIGALVLFWLVVLAGAIWGGVNGTVLFDVGIESNSSTDDVVIAALSGGIAFALCGGLPAVFIGAIAGPLAASIISRRRITLHPLKRRYLPPPLLADSLLILGMVIMGAIVAWLIGFGFLLMFFHAGE